jgi:hypothetical protein
MAQTAMDQSRAYQNELFSDAAQQVSQQGGATAFSAKPGGYLQFRYNANWRDDDNIQKGFSSGFQNARTRLNIGGNVFNEDWGYFVQFGWSDESYVDAPPDPVTGAPTTFGGFSSSGQTLLEDAYGTYKFGNGWNLKFGQFKDPFLREELVGDTAQLAMDRSVTNSAFTHGRSQGIQVGFEQESFRLFAALTDGLRTANTDFVSPAEADFAITARGEFMWAGAWKDADQFTSWQNSSFFGMVGAAASYQSGGSTFNTAQAPVPPGPQADPGDMSIMGVTADVTVKGNGWNAFAAGVMTISDPGTNSAPGTVIPYPGNGTPGGAGASTQTDFAILAQGGIFVAPQWELFGRADWIFPDSSRTVPGGPQGDDEMLTLGIGANYYISPDSQACKLTIQANYFVDSQSRGIAPSSTLTGLLGSNKDPQFGVSAQIQLVF